VKIEETYLTKATAVKYETEEYLIDEEDIKTELEVLEEPESIEYDAFDEDYDVSEELAKRPRKQRKLKQTEDHHQDSNDDRSDDLVREFILIKCHICGQEFDQVNQVFSHSKQVHNEQGIIKCCGRNFRRRTEVLTHALEHKHPDKYLTCDICQKRFKSKKNMENHKMVIHTTDEEKVCIAE
jgi:hypothetical protein